METAPSDYLTARDHVSLCAAREGVGHQDTFCSLTDVSTHHRCPTPVSTKQSADLD